VLVQDFKFQADFEVMQPIQKKGKAKAGKAGGGGQLAEKAVNNPPKNSPSSYYSEEDLVDYEPESPAIYLGDEDDMSPDYDYWPAQEDGPATIMQPTPNFPAIAAEDSNVAGRSVSSRPYSWPVDT
jgi:hypothetical protein